VRGVNYFFRTDDFPTHGFPANLQSGFIAQEVEELIPEAVSTDSTSGMKRMSYKSVTPYLVEAVKEQQERIEGQQERIGELEGELGGQKENFNEKLEGQQQQIEELQRQVRELLQRL
jgi:chromosome segregation ATPase